MRLRNRVVVTSAVLTSLVVIYILLIVRVEKDSGGPTAGGLRGIKNQPYLQQQLDDLELGVASSQNALNNARQRVIQVSRQAKDDQDEASSPTRSNTCSFDSLERSSDVVSVKDIYQNIPFDNEDGGVWKQGWDLQVNQTRMSGKKLRVFVVPHSHNDPGWIKTFEGYFGAHTKHILNNMVNFLTDHPSMRFIWAETSYFALWWETISSDEGKQLVRNLLQNGQLEIVTGGWVMNDEGSTDIFAMITQMIEGHEWLKKHLSLAPRHGWSIDPFGVSPSMAFLLERAGFDGMVVQRVHYSIKKYLARFGLLEFMWRQEWQTHISRGSHLSKKDSGITCHVMPFYSYDVPHSCGPDPKVCCQFDFRRMPPFKLTCPWKVNPTPITSFNVEARARLLADQYWKKAMLFKSNAILVPLGDDFRFEKLKEWDLQYSNYNQLFKFMNSAPDLNMEVSFGTLADYFDYIRDDHQLQGRTLPSLTGDFFTYSDRDDHYWSGYYTTRPFYKRYDRLLESLLRSTDILFSVASLHNLSVSTSKEIRQQLQYVRQNLALFQHHDAITGTSRVAVVNDYAERMHRSIVWSHRIMEKILAELYSAHGSESKGVEFTQIFVGKDSLPQNQPLELEGDGQESLIVFNSLTHDRQELICFDTTLSSSGVSVTDKAGSALAVQTSFLWDGSTILTDRIESCVVVSLKALSLTVLNMKGREKPDPNIFSRVSLINFHSSVNIPDNNFVSKGVPDADITIESDILRVVIDGKTGMMKRVIQLDEFALSQTHEVTMDFLSYGTVSEPKKEKSGAYLFLPDSKKAVPIPFVKPQIIVSKGPLFTRVEILFSEPMNLRHVITIADGQPYVNIQNEFHLVKGSYISNKEFVMRINSQVANKNVFFTDLNGLQMIRRERLDKIPIQGNVYPIATMAYIEDEITRMYVLTAQPLGGISPEPGVFDVFQDRRLLQDDSRGLGEGVTDNPKTRLSFKLMFEIKPMNDVKPSLKASKQLYQLLHPPLAFHTKLEPTADDIYLLHESLPCDVHLLNLRTSLLTEDIFLTLHRFGVSCGTGCDTTSPIILSRHLSLPLIQRIHPDISRMSLTTLYEQKSNISIQQELYLDQMDLVTFALKPSSTPDTPQAAIPHEETP